MTTKKYLYSHTLGLIVSMTLTGMAHAVTLAFTNNVYPSNPYSGYIDTGSGSYQGPLTAGTEFCIISPFSNYCVDGYKDTMFGGEKWIFDNHAGNLLATAGFPGNPGADPAYSGFPSACFTANDPACPILQQPAIFFGAPLSFLAPVVGSPAGNLYGVGKLVSLTCSRIKVFFPVLEAQYGGAVFPLGAAATPDRKGNLRAGITFSGPVAGRQFRMTAQHLIDATEDMAGLAGFIPTWELTGVILDAPKKPKCKKN